MMAGNDNDDETIIDKYKIMTLLSILCTMGLPIDESLDRLLVAMEAFPNVAILGNTIGFAVSSACFSRCASAPTSAG